MSRWAKVICGLLIVGAIAGVLLICTTLIALRNHPSRRLMHDIRQHGGDADIVDESPGWVPYWLGSEFYARPEYVWFLDASLDDQDFARLSKQMATVSGLEISGTELTDDGLRHLANMPQLSSLKLGGPGITG